MAPKRKSSTAALGNTFYPLQGSMSSKKRLIPSRNDEELISLSRSSTNMPNDPAAEHLTSPSLENIVTGFGKLTAPFPPSSAGAASRSATPVTPLSARITVGEAQSQQHERPKTYLVMGASRGIGLEFAKQVLQGGHQVIAVVRNPQTASQLWQGTGSVVSRPGSCVIEQCDISSPASIETFMNQMRRLVERGGAIDTIVLNAGILEYKNGLGTLNVEFETFEKHIRVNCVGNVILAQKLLMLNELESVKQRREYLQLHPDPEISAPLIGRQVMFMSSDSGSMADFREYEDGFAAYGASKAALNMMVRHMAAELKRRGSKKREAASQNWQYGPSDESYSEEWEDEVCVLAMHPGEVNTDMANIDLSWDVEGVISAEESVRCMLDVLKDKNAEKSGTFWRWDGTEHPW